MPTRAVDIIIPMAHGDDAARSCIDAVLASAQATPFELLVIDDGSPEQALADYLAGLREAGRITLITQPKSLGFVRSVNLGIVQHPDRDVVILASDTLVHGDWLDRLQRCAYSSPDVGTVTPFSSLGGFAGYPRVNAHNALSANPAQLDQLFSEINAGCYLEIPAGTRACMYITRRCLDRVGPFDAMRFSEGGEEVDFCACATELGFKHLLCGEVFVGSCAPMLMGTDLAAEGQGLLVQDPARPLRRRVDLARLARSGKDAVLMIGLSRARGGGVEKHMLYLAKLLESRFEVFALRPEDQAGLVSVSWLCEGEDFSAYFRLPQALDRLAAFLKVLRLVRVHVHHTLDYHPSLWRLSDILGVPYDFTLHDYYSICPQFTLALEDGRYCGEPDVDGCTACLARRPAPLGLDILSWRARSRVFLEGAERVIGPSQDVIQRVSRYAPGAHYVHLPHPEADEDISTFPDPRSREIKVLVLGVLSVGKGVKVLEACAVDAEARKLPLYFRLLGTPCVAIKTEPELPLSVSGEYADDDLPALILHERADLFFFPAQAPETYSYTLTQAMRTGLPIVASKLGAFIERLQGYRRAHLIDWRMPPAAINDLLINIIRKPELQAPTTLAASA